MHTFSDSKSFAVVDAEKCATPCKADELRNKDSPSSINFLGGLPLYGV